MTRPTPTRSAVLELQDERRAMRDGYQFLDEKRMVLAAEMLAELRRYEADRRRFLDLLSAAMQTLRAAVARHGLDGLQVYPPAHVEHASLSLMPRQLLGVRLVTASFEYDAGRGPDAVQPSPEAEACRRQFTALIAQTAGLAATAGNLERLRHEYRRTERRARALEEVLMPEADQTIREIEGQLEEMEQEDAVRVRNR
jgi:V/A-type H+-transporting ATPase subunit D